MVHGLVRADAKAVEPLRPYSDNDRVPDETPADVEPVFPLAYCRRRTRRVVVCDEGGAVVLGVDDNVVVYVGIAAHDARGSRRLHHGRRVEIGFYQPRLGARPKVAYVGVAPLLDDIVARPVDGPHGHGLAVGRAHHGRAGQRAAAVDGPAQRRPALCPGAVAVDAYLLASAVAVAGGESVQV